MMFKLNISCSDGHPLSAWFNVYIDDMYRWLLISSVAMWEGVEINQEMLSREAK